LPPDECQSAYKQLEIVRERRHMTNSHEQSTLDKRGEAEKPQSHEFLAKLVFVIVLSVAYTISVLVLIYPVYMYYR
jgi:hypothetical protein